MRPMTPQPTIWRTQALQQHATDVPPVTPPPPPPAPTPDPTGLSQAQVDQIVGREKATTEAATKKAIADQFGVTLERAAEIIKAANERDEAEKSDAQKAKDAADKAKADSDAAASAAATTKHELDVIKALARAGVPIVARNDKGEIVDDVKAQDAVEAKLAKMVLLVDAAPGSDAATIATAVTALKETMPELFVGASTVPPVKPGKTPATDPKIPAPKGTELNEDAMSKGAERAKRDQTRPAGYAWENAPQPAASP